MSKPQGVPVVLPEARWDVVVLLLLESVQRLEAEGRADLAAEVAAGVLPAVLDGCSPGVRLEGWARWVEREAPALEAAGVLD